MKKVLMILICLLVSSILFNGKGRATAYYGEEEIKAIFLKEFQKRTNYPSGEISLEKFRIEPLAYKIPKGTPYRIEWIGNAKAGSNTAILNFNLNGAENQILRVWGFIEVWVPVVVVKNNLPNKAPLTKEDLVIEKRELSRLPQDVVMNIEEVLDKETRMSLKGGTVLRKAHVADPLVIKRNQEVEIIARGKYFEVKAKGIALQPGRLNELIRVKNISSQKTLQVKVIDEGKVEVLF